MEMTKTQIESLWIELENIPFDENENSEMVLSNDWEHFKAGTTQTEIWEWFDSYHENSVAYLVNEFEYQA